MYADDICCFCPSVVGMQEILKVFHEFATDNDIVFNTKKSVAMNFFPKSFSISKLPAFKLGCDVLKFADLHQYLGINLASDLSDDKDIYRQIRSLYCAGNKLKSRFRMCNTTVKNYLFRIYCNCFYACQLWSNFKRSSYHRLSVAYNDSYRILHGIPRWISARKSQVHHNVLTLDALVRKNMWGFIERCAASSNAYIYSLMRSDVYYKSDYYLHCKLSLLCASEDYLPP